MMPILYKADETDFSHGGIGTLADTLSCMVTEERNSIFDLTLEYPVNGLHYEELKEQCIIKAKADDSRDDQLFTIVSITTPMNKKVSVYAQHITYQMSGNIVIGFRSSGTPPAIMNHAFRQAVFSNRFSFLSDITSVSEVYFGTPVSLSQIMGGTEGSILSKWSKGEYKRDNFTMYFLANRGQNRGVTIAYGKNLTDIKQEVSIASTATHIIPYATYNNDGVETTVYAEPHVLPSPYVNQYAFHHALPVDFSSKFENDDLPTKEKLLSLGNEYITANDVGIPSVNVTVKWIPLDKVGEYQNNAVLERVSLCDTVTVIFEELGIHQEAKVIKIRYDTLKERIEEAQIGDAKSNFGDTFQQAMQKVEDIPQDIQSTIAAAIDNNTKLMTGVKGGHVYFKLDANKKPQEIFIMDTEDLGTAQKLWRWNLLGFAYSANGVNGPYETAINMQGQIIGKFIYGLEIYGSQIFAGSITSEQIQTGTITGDKLATNAIQVGFNEMGDILRLSPDTLSFFNQGIRIMTLGQNGMEFFQGNSRIGHMGTIGWKTNPNKKGIGLNLDDGSFVSFNFRQQGTSEYNMMLGFSNDSEFFSSPGVQLGNNLNLNDNVINVNSGVKLTSMSDGGGGLMGSWGHPVYIGYDREVYLSLDQNQLYANRDINMQGNTIRNVHIVEATGGTARSLPLETEAVFSIGKMVEWIGEGTIKNGVYTIEFPHELFGQIEDFHVSLTPYSENHLFIEKKEHGFLVKGQEGDFSYKVTAKKIVGEIEKMAEHSPTESSPSPITFEINHPKKEEDDGFIT